MALKIGKLFKSKRNNLHLTQVEAADLIGVSLRSIIYWERGNHEPRSRLVRQAAMDFIRGEYDELVIVRRAAANGIDF